MSIVRVKAKSGKVYFYPSYYQKSERIIKGELKTSKSGKVYRYYYKRKNSDWQGLKKNKLLCLKRDNFECQLCGSKINIDTHHVDKKGPHQIGMVNADNTCNNLIALCRKCHQKLHYGISDKQISDKHLQILKHRESGLTLQEIGNIYGVSRQRIFQVIQKIP